MTTIYDVARLAGVSPKTVSRVLNADGAVRGPTRAAVQGAIDELGYVPSSAARRMRGGRSRIVGLITGAISGADMPDEPGGLPDLFIVRGIQRALEHAGLTVMIADTGGKVSRVAPLVRTFLEHRVEGLIYVADHHRVVELPAQAKDAKVVLANCSDAARTPCVLPDDRHGQRQLTEQLIAAGHRRIAYLTLGERMTATKLRLSGYRDALEAAGIAYDPTIVHPTEVDGSEIDAQLLWDAADRLLEQPDPPTAIACGNDRLAMRLYGILRQRGREPGRDISVAGYDDYRLISEALVPPLTTAELPYGAIGARAAELLVAMMRGDERPDGPVLVRGPVRWRASVAEAGGANIIPLSRAAGPRTDATSGRNAS